MSKNNLNKNENYMDIFDLFAPIMSEKQIMYPSKHSFASIEKTENEYIIEMDVPGFSKNEISIYVEEKTLHIEAKKEEETKRKNIIQTYQLSNFDIEKINAKLENGVLTVIVPFLPKPKVEKKIVEIQ